MALAACAAAGALALVACSKNNSAGSVAGTTGAFGSVPPASGTPHPGTITWAESPGSSPTWIFPVTLVPQAVLAPHHRHRQTHHSLPDDRLANAKPDYQPCRASWFTSTNPTWRYAGAESVCYAK